MTLAPRKAVIFDVDGTLTPSVLSIIRPRHGAADAVRAFCDAGFEIIYLSARIRILQSGLNDWLTKNGFPAGHLHMTQNREDRTDTAAFKERVLQSYVKTGWSFAAAFGDSSSDFQAYVKSGIPMERIFALRRQGHAHCQPGVWQGCYGGWDELRAKIAAILVE